MSLKKSILATALCILVAQGCGTPKEEEEGSSEPGPIRVSWPIADRQETGDGVLTPFELKEKSFAGSGRFRSIFWLDFEGATVTAAESFIVKNAGQSQVVIPPFASSDIGSNEDRESLKLTLVQNLVQLFPDVDIKLTTTRPVSDIYSRVHIGGNNFTGKPRVVGIAPLDLGNRIGDDILFIYSRDLLGQGNVEAIKTKLSHVIAHEIAHALGARHIDNNAALMKTSVSLEADSFNESGPVVGTPTEKENSQQILIQSAGSRALAFAEQNLPNIVDLAAFSTGGVIQYTVISKANFIENPAINLPGFRYLWTFEGQQSEGTSVLMSFSDKNDHLLNLTVVAESGATRKFQFSVGHRQ